MSGTFYNTSRLGNDSIFCIQFKHTSDLPINVNTLNVFFYNKGDHMTNIIIRHFLTASWYAKRALLRHVGHL